MAAKLAQLTAISLGPASCSLDSTIREYSNLKCHKINQSREPLLCWHASTSNRSASERWFLQL